MNRQCEIVQDLLPLYVDEICSPASREVVAEHVSSCAECAGVLRKLKNSEIEQNLASEKEGVLEKQNRLFKRKSVLWGVIIGCALMIPVIICFIVTVASGSSIRELLIVLSAILLAASLTVVPLIVPKNKLLWTLGLGTVCLIVLLATSITYGESRWFFVAATGVLFGLSVVFSPMVVNHKAVRGYLGNHKALVVMASDTIWFVLMMLSIGLTTGDPSFWYFGVRISAVMLVLAWLIFVIIRYLKTNGLIRAGICCIIIGGFLFVFNNLMAVLMGGQTSWPQLALSEWNMYTIDGNVMWLCLIAGCLIGLILIVIGLIKGGKRR